MDDLKAMKALFRADASLTDSSGHVMRSLVLATELRKRGWSVEFISFCDNEELRNHMAKSVDRVEFLGHQRQKTDSAIIKSYRDNKDVDLIILDSYELNEAYHREIRDDSTVLMLIDDQLKLSRYQCNILLNNNIFASDLNYGLSDDIRSLMGARYFLLNEAFRAAPPRTRLVHEEARKILVTLGGADSRDLVSRVVSALIGHCRPDMEVRVVVGAMYRFRDSLRNQIRNLSCRVDLIDFNNDMAELMSWADVAVTAGGITCLEMAYMGLPMAVTAAAENQVRTTRTLGEMGCAVTCGADEAGFSAAIGHLLTSGEDRARLSDNCRRLIDGRGTVRVADEIEAFMKRQSRRPFSWSP